MDMKALMQQAKDMKNNMKAIKNELEKTLIVGEGGRGKVKVVMTGSYKVKNVEIDSQALDDLDKLNSMIMVAINDATSQVEKVASKKMKSTGMPKGIF